MEKAMNTYARHSSTVVIPVASCEPTIVEQQKLLDQRRELEKQHTQDMAELKVKSVQNTSKRCHESKYENREKEISESKPKTDEIHEGLRHDSMIDKNVRLVRKATPPDNIKRTEEGGMIFQRAKENELHSKLEFVRKNNNQVCKTDRIQDQRKTVDKGESRLGTGLTRDHSYHDDKQQNLDVKKRKQDLMLIDENNRHVRVIQPDNEKITGAEKLKMKENEKKLLQREWSDSGVMKGINHQTSKSEQSQDQRRRTVIEVDRSWLFERRAGDHNIYDENRNCLQEAKRSDQNPMREKDTDARTMIINNNDRRVREAIAKTSEGEIIQQKMEDNKTNEGKTNERVDIRPEKRINKYNTANYEKQRKLDEEKKRKQELRREREIELQRLLILRADDFERMDELEQNYDEQVKTLERKKQSWKTRTWEQDSSSKQNNPSNLKPGSRENTSTVSSLKFHSQQLYRSDDGV